MISFPIYVVCKLLFLGRVCQFHGFTQQAEYTIPLWTVLWHQFSCFLVHWNTVQAMPTSAQHAMDAVSRHYLASISLTLVVHNSIKSTQGGQRSPVWRSCFHAFLWHGSEDSLCPQKKKPRSFTQKSFGIAILVSKLLMTTLRNPEVLLYK